MASKLTLEDMQKTAEHYDGKCLSKEYINEYTPLKWMCKKGHTWESDYAIVKQGGWCVQCSKKHKDKTELLEEIKQIAEAKGGKCLSTVYINSKLTLEFECAKGHQWQGLIGNIKKGTWCKKCAIEKHSEERKKEIETYQTIAAAHGGKCLSTEYKNSYTKLKFECAKGHQWRTQAYIVKQKHWCPKCGIKIVADKHRDNLELFQKIAEDKGGKCLSTEYFHGGKLLKFECAEGHTWKATGNNIKGGHWCLRCSKKNRIIPNKDSLQTFINIATERGGKCLSTHYTNAHTPLKFECAKGHRWKGIPAGVKKGVWCAKCAHIKRGIETRDSIEIYQKIAQERGGKCLSTEYKDNKTKLKFECAKGHIWKGIPYNIKQGVWCIECSYQNRGASQRDTLETFYKIAQERGGKCLSTEYFNTNEKLKFECAKGHHWKANGNSIKSRGSWCPKCDIKTRTDKFRDNIDIYHTIAAFHNGKCLSEKYKNRSTKLKFECEKGHQWKTSAGIVKGGSWCPQCDIKTRGSERKDKIETYQKIAEEHGGKCLSTEYINSREKLKFECAKGHKWETTAINVKQGSWCLRCGWDKKKAN